MTKSRPEKSNVEEGLVAPHANTSTATVNQSNPSAIQANQELIQVGFVLGAWGIQGWLKIRPASAEAVALLKIKSWWLAPGQNSLDKPGQTAPVKTAFTVQEAKRQGDTVVARLQEISDRNQAEAMQGHSIWIARNLLPKTKKDEFYWLDLIGCQVLDQQGQSLGEVSGLIETGPHAVLKISSAEGSQTMIPFVNAYISNVNLRTKTIIADWSRSWDE